MKRNARKRQKLESGQQTLSFSPLPHVHDVKDVLPTNQEVLEWKRQLHVKYTDWVEETPLALERMYPHPRDKALVFIDTDGAHMYFFYPDLIPNPLSRSVTSLKKDVMPNQRFEEVAKQHVMKQSFADGESRWSPFLTADGVLLAWELNREQAALQGTVFHRRVEGKLNEPFMDKECFPEEHAELRRIQQTCGEPKMEEIHNRFDFCDVKPFFCWREKRKPLYEEGQIWEFCPVKKGRIPLVDFVESEDSSLCAEVRI